MYLIAGLGNPGARYQGTRHNAGYRVVEKLLRSTVPGTPVKKENGYLQADVLVESRRMIIIQPLVYMNRSGIAVLRALGKYGLSAGSLMVVYDDMDLEPGVLRIRPYGGSGGHRGVESVMRELGTENFKRLRIGIGKPPEEVDGADYVLGCPRPAEEEILSQAEDAAVRAILEWVSNGLESAMNKFNPLR